MSSVEQFPQYGFYLIAETAEDTQLGSYVTNGGDLTLIQLRFYHKNASAFSYTLQVVGSATLNGPTLFSSDVETVTDVILGQTTAHFLFDMSFDFNGYNLLDNETYFLRLVTTGYTRDVDTVYLGVNCDWLEPIGTASTAGARASIGVML